MFRRLKNNNYYCVICDLRCTLEFLIMKPSGSFVFLFLGLIGNCFGLRETVVIGKSEFQCGENGRVVEVKSENTKIRLPSNAYALFSINTERASKCMKPQSCIFMTWKIIRDLEIYLNVHFRNTGVNGIVEFQNDMVIPGFNYLLHVTLKTDGRIEEREYNLTFSSDQNSKRKETVFGQLSLNIGTKKLYRSLPIIINANVTLCENISYYYFRWSVITNGQEVVLPTKSMQLSISPSSVQIQDDNLCVIICKVMNFSNSAILLKESINLYINDNVEVNEDNLEVFLPFKYSTFSRGVAIFIAPFIYSSNGNYQTDWSCRIEDTYLDGCQGQINEEFYMDTGFNQEGNYSLTLVVKSNNVKKVATCNILVVSDVPSIRLGVIYPVRPQFGIELSAKISELRTYCVVQWLPDRYWDSYEIISNTIYNISSKDKSFLEELMELGNVTVTRNFILGIPPPSRTWIGLKSNNYSIKLTVKCPSIKEISDMKEMKAEPDDFLTISAEIDFFVPSLPEAESLDVFSEGGYGLSSDFYFVTKKIRKVNDLPMMYKFGIIFNDLDVIVYSGIDIFSAKVILPFNGDVGIETYVEVCDNVNRCGKCFGPLIVPRVNNDLDDKEILRTLKQKLIEEDFYKVFAFAVIVLHSSSFLNQTDKYSIIFSSEILAKLQTLLLLDDVNVVNDCVKNLAIFINHLKLSDNLIIKLSELTHEFLINSQDHLRSVRHVSRNILFSSNVNMHLLEQTQNYIKTTEHILLNSKDAETNDREKDHMFSLLDRWMSQACILVFEERLVLKLELKTIALSIEKESLRMLNDFHTVPFNHNAWNMTVYLKINNSEASSNLCIGYAWLKNIFYEQEITFGANLYSSESDQYGTNISTEVTILLPKPKNSPNESQCSVYKNGLNFLCSSSRYYATFVECICPSFGYYLLDSISNTTQEDMAEFNFTKYSNTTSEISYENTVNKNMLRIGKQISYVLIISSLVGFFILCYIIRKLTIFPQHTGFNDNSHYGHVMHDDLMD